MSRQQPLRAAGIRNLATAVRSWRKNSRPVAAGSPRQPQYGPGTEQPCSTAGQAFRPAGVSCHWPSRTQSNTGHGRSHYAICRAKQQDHAPVVQTASLSAAGRITALRLVTAGGIAESARSRGKPLPFRNGSQQGGSAPHPRRQSGGPDHGCRHGTGPTRQRLQGRHRH